MIGDVIIHEGELASTSDISLARASTLSLVLTGLIAIAYGLYAIISRIVKKQLRKRRIRNGGY